MSFSVLLIMRIFVSSYDIHDFILYIYIYIHYIPHPGLVGVPYSWVGPSFSADLIGNHDPVIDCLYLDDFEGAWISFLLFPL